MHQHLLFASVPAGRLHDDLLRQLAALAAMPPAPLREHRLVLRPWQRGGGSGSGGGGGGSGGGGGTTAGIGAGTAAAGSNNANAAGVGAAAGFAGIGAGPGAGLAALRVRAGGSQEEGAAVSPAEVQRLGRMLAAPLRHMQLVRALPPVVDELAAEEAEGAAATAAQSGKGNGGANGGAHGSRPINGRTAAATTSAAATPWRLEFADTPEAGATTTTARLIGGAVLGPDPLPAVEAWGYEPIAEYVVDGSRIVLDDAVISFFRVLYPKPSQPYATSTLSASLSSSPIPIPNPQSLHLLDPSGAFIIEAALAAPDGAGPDVLAAAGQRLLALRERLRHVVRLEPGERLAMDVRVK